MGCTGLEIHIYIYIYLHIYVHLFRYGFDRRIGLRVEGKGKIWIVDLYVGSSYV